MRKIVALLVGVVLAVVFVGAEVARAAPAASTADACLKYEDQTYRACVAYTVNASLVSLVPYYKFGRSSNESRANLALSRLRSRYVGNARQLLTRRVSAWPVGEYEVSPPRISVLSARVNQRNGTAILVTRETWLVRTKRGAIRFQEASRRHVITMRRTQGLIFKKWVVSNIA